MKYAESNLIKEHLNKDNTYYKFNYPANKNTIFRSLYGYDSDDNNIVRFLKDFGLEKYTKKFVDEEAGGTYFNMLFEENGNNRIL